MTLGLCSYRRANLPHCRRWTVAIGLAVFTLVPPAAQAAPIEFHYGGVITSADAGAGVALGDRFDGTFTYDPQINPFYSYYENGRFYSFSTLNDGWATAIPDTSAASFTINGRTVFSQQGGLGLSLYEVDDDDPIIPNPRTVLQINTFSGPNLTLINPHRGVFGSLAVPTAIDLADFSTATVSVTERDAASGTYLTYKGTIDTLTKLNMTTTPEPASVALWLGLGVAAWAVKVRSRS